MRVEVSQVVGRGQGGKLRHRQSSESVDIDVVAAESMKYVDVVRLQAKAPPHERGVIVFECHQVAKGRVIRDDGEWAAPEVTVVLLDGPDDGNALTFGGGPNSLRLGKGAACAGQNAFDAVVVKLDVG